MTHKIFVGLNEHGNRALREFLRDNLKQPHLADDERFFSACANDVDVDRNPGAYELSGRYTKTGNPATARFSDSEMEEAAAED